MKIPENALIEDFCITANLSNGSVYPTLSYPESIEKTRIEMIKMFEKDNVLSIVDFTYEAKYVWMKNKKYMYEWVLIPNRI